MGKPDLPRKLCPVCGRYFEWRKAWERNWDSVKYCSEKCRRSKPRSRDAEIENAIIGLLRARTGSICPSEAARQVFAEDWRQRMDSTRNAGRRLAAAGTIVVTQKGREVDAATARGAIRYARGPGFPLSD